MSGPRSQEWMFQISPVLQRVGQLSFFGYWEKTEKKTQKTYQLVVEPTPSSKKICLSNWIIFPRIRANMKKYLKNKDLAIICNAR